VTFSFMYTTTIFGMNEITLPQAISTVPEDIYNLIDEFRGENDGFFKETGYIKPYSSLLDLMANFLPVIFSALYVEVLSRTLPKVTHKVGFILSFLYAGVLAIGTGWVTLVTRESYLLAKNNRYEKFPERLFIWNDNEKIDIRKYCIRNGRMIELVRYCRPLSDMRPKKRAPSNHMLQADRFLGHKDLDKKEEPIIFFLEDGKINAYLFDDFRCKLKKFLSLPTPEKVNSVDFFKSLPTPEKVNSIAFFKKRNLMVATSKRGIIQWESEKNKKLYKIMNSTEVTQYN